MIKTFRGLGTNTSPLKMDNVSTGIRLNTLKLIPETSSLTYDPTLGEVPPSMWVVISRVSHASINAAVVDIANLVFAVFVPSGLTVSNGVTQTGVMPASIEVDVLRTTDADSCYIHFGETQFLIELDFEPVNLTETERALLTQLAYL